MIGRDAVAAQAIGGGSRASAPAAPAFVAAGRWSRAHAEWRGLQPADGLRRLVPGAESRTRAAPADADLEPEGR